MDDITRVKIAKERIKKGWMKGGMAEDSFGHTVPPDDPTACRWCLLGALGTRDLLDAEKFPAVLYLLGERIAPGLHKFHATPAARARYITEWNDHCADSPEHVIELLDHVREKLELSEQHRLNLQVQNHE
jgi:hypothetical protein